MKVRDLMTTAVTWARPNTSIRQIAKLMRQENIGAVPVCSDRGELLGIVTDRDIVIRSLSGEEDKAEAQDIMTKHPVSVHPDMNTHQAALLFARYQVRRLPVVESGKLTGMLTLADLARKTLYIDEAGDALSAISRPSTLN
ncbi:CBS domain-containing protein [Bacilliculturomica massiliensis]|uniref:CBS domain-containing protein n=1 Tax=Bacilliculturomica massiliensis TaxID=1917867 RepID=UPI001030201B|nr:CBS domain-containing protein [Bacilliculturomica massiliensis]